VNRYWNKMKLNQPIGKLLIMLLVLFNFGCDQLTKEVARTHISEYERISVIKDHFTLLKVENTGAFLSSGESLPAPVKTILLNILPLSAIFYGLYMLMKKNDFNLQMTLGISLIVSGGLGNLYDRIRYGSVTDFMHLDFNIVQTGVFNVADLFITAGVGLILISIYSKKIAV